MSLQEKREPIAGGGELRARINIQNLLAAPRADASRPASNPRSSSNLRRRKNAGKLANTTAGRKGRINLKAAPTREDLEGLTPAAAEKWVKLQNLQQLFDGGEMFNIPVEQKKLFCVITP